MGEKTMRLLYAQALMLLLLSQLLFGLKPLEVHAEEQDVIAFSSQRDIASPKSNSPSEIYVINADGTGLTNLTNYPTADDFLPSWSPDGTKLAFTSNRDGDYEIFIADYDSGSRSLSNVAQITHNSSADRFPTWVKGAAEMVFMSTRANNGNFELWKINLQVADPDTTAVRLTNTPGIEDCCASASPDGNNIVYASLATGDFELYTMDITGSTFTPINITNRPSPDSTSWRGYDGTPSWSSNGKIVYRSLRPENYYRNDIYEIDPSTGDSVQLTINASAKQPTASPDTNWVAYSKGPDNKEDIWIYDRQNGTHNALYSGAGKDKDASWRPTGNGAPIPPDPDPDPDPDPIGPDLIVESISWLPQNPYSGQQVTFSAVIKNIGDQPTFQSHHGVLFGIDQQWMWVSWNTTPLQPGETRLLTATQGTGGNSSWFAKTGVYNITATVDNNNYQPEADETNNSLTDTVTIP